MQAIPLPPEILETVFWYLDERSFFVSLLTCKQFWIVGSSRRNLLRQIKRIPGLRYGLEYLTTQQLFREFRRRAAQAAYGAEMLVDVKGCQTPRGSRHSLACMITCDLSSDATRVSLVSLLALPNQNGTIGIYKVTANDVSLVQTLSPRELFPIGLMIEVFALSFAPDGHLVVLCGHANYQCPCDKNPDLGQCLCLTTLESVCIYKAAIYELSELPFNYGMPDFSPSEFIPPILLPSAENRPTSIIMDTSRGSICVAWKSSFASRIASLSYVRRISDENGAYYPCFLAPHGL